MMTEHTNARGDLGPEENPLDKVLSRLKGLRKTKKGHEALCPAHDDQKPSLSVDVGSDGRVLLNCFAGCEVRDIVAAIELELRDLFPRKWRPGKGDRQITRTDAIRNHLGEIQAYHVRVDYANGEKECRWQHSDGTYGLKKRKVTTLPLYGSELTPECKPGTGVVLVEGEPAKDALEAAGIRALATVTGAANMPDREVLDVLKDMDVCLWPDNDAEGRAHMDRVAQNLQGIAQEIRWFIWEDAPEKADAADHPVVSGGDLPDIRDLRRELASAPLWSPENSDTLGIDTILASSVKPEDVEWLWDKRIPFGKLTIFDGDPDQEKSVVTMDIASRVSTGRGFPGGATCEVGNVAIANVEDGIADTIVPRLMAHGADLNRIQIIDGIPDGEGSKLILDIPGDIPILERLVVSKGIKLLIVDPLLTMLGGDANKDQDSRKALTPLKEMAERTGCAVIAVRHLNKSVGLKAIQCGGGNMGLVGVARAGAFFATDPDDKRRRVMAQLKKNVAGEAQSLLYRITGADVVHEGETINTARVEWLGFSEYDANGLAAAEGKTPHEKSQLDEAKEFLEEMLSGGPMWANTILNDARKAGVSQTTLYRAKAQLRVKSDRIGEEGWQWSLPTKDEDPGKGSQDPDNEYLDNLGNLDNLHSMGEALYTDSNNNGNGHMEDCHDNLPKLRYLSEGSQDCQDYQVYEPTVENALGLLERRDSQTLLEQWRDASDKNRSQRWASLVSCVAKEGGCFGDKWELWREPVAEAVEKLEPEEGR
jgi:putative DNA primase/helicase